MFFPFPTPMSPVSGTGDQLEHARDRLREYAKQNGLTIRNSEGRVLEIDELLDEALGSAPRISLAGPIIGIGLLVLFITWIVIVLVFLR
jgi:hypothetical protein